jgi:hypothetical protein
VIFIKLGINFIFVKIFNFLINREKQFKLKNTGPRPRRALTTQRPYNTGLTKVMTDIGSVDFDQCRSCAGPALFPSASKRPQEILYDKYTKYLPIDTGKGIPVNKIWKKN